MICSDPGHVYALNSIDGDGGPQVLTFMKREGPGFPGNVGAHPGVNCQEVLRALIARVIYLNRQIGCRENTLILQSLRNALRLFEVRAANRHGLFMPATLEDIENLPTCATCGHLACRHG